MYMIIMFDVLMFLLILRKYIVIRRNRTQDLWTVKRV